MAMYTYKEDYVSSVDTALEYKSERKPLADRIYHMQSSLDELAERWILYSQMHENSLDKLWDIVKQDNCESKGFWNLKEAESDFITSGKVTTPSVDNQSVFLDASFLYPGDTNKFKSSAEIQDKIEKSTEWTKTLWLKPEEMLERMMRCRNSIEIKVKDGKSVFFSTYNCLQKTTGDHKSPCISRFMGFSVEDTNNNQVANDGFNNELGKRFVMGIGVSCREDKSHGGDDKKPKKQCIVSASPSVEETNTIPYFWMFNSEAPETVHVLGTNQFFRGTTKALNPPTCPQWVPKDMRHYSKVLQHLMMYKTLVAEIEEHSPAKHWKVLRSMGVGYVFAYAIVLEDGTMDFVLARSKVPLSLPDVKMHSNSHQMPLGGVYTQGLDTAEEYELDPMEHMESSIWMDEPSYMTPMATNNAAPTPPVNSRGGRWYPWRVPVTHGD